MLKFLQRIFKEESLLGEPDTRLKVDLHSHLCAGIDDGVKTVEEATEIIRILKSSGVEKIITTPHIQSDHFKNTPEIINEKLAELRTHLQKENIQINIEAAAEYYIDETFDVQLQAGNKLMTFGKNFLLVETSYLSKPFGLERLLFDLKMEGYSPVLAHPERYSFLENPKMMTKLFETGVHFQLNLLSLAGMYSPSTKKAAEFMVKNKMFTFVGSDIHNIRHAQALHELKKTKVYAELMEMPLINNSLL